VDLGLPSGLLWATCNVGASEPWENGLYFSWGNVDGHKKDSGYDFSETKYQTTPGASLIDNILLDVEYDAARANFGGSWRMPTAAEFYELCDNCTRTWVTQNGVNGRLFTSKINGNSVFFPCAGYYDGTTLYDEDSCGDYWSSSFISQTYAFELTFDIGCVLPQFDDNRSIGYPVRAVLGHPKDSLLIKAIKKS
jgi:hypothetical protein